VTPKLPFPARVRSIPQVSVLMRGHRLPQRPVYGATLVADRGQGSLGSVNTRDSHGGGTVHAESCEPL
jgi:hypothetical protein